MYKNHGKKVVQACNKQHAKSKYDSPIYICSMCTVVSSIEQEFWANQTHQQLLHPAMTSDIKFYIYHDKIL